LKSGILFVLLVILDQLTKALIRNAMVVGQSIPVIGNTLQLTYVENTGIAFGIPVAHPIIYIVLSIAASIGIFIYLLTHRHEGFIVQISLVLILSGAVGNLIDRILFGKVVDFVNVGFGPHRWPVFNVADSVVVIGMGFLFAMLFFVKKNSSDEATADGG
jgi:signal peptidase II